MTRFPFARKYTDEVSHQGSFSGHKIVIILMEFMQSILAKNPYKHNERKK
jgi:hypothetical protein